MNRSILKRFYWVFYAIVLIAVTVMYGLLINGENIWGDEVFTMDLVKDSYGGIWKRTASDVHPPLYYWMLKVFMSVTGYGIYQAKFFSMIAYVCILALAGVQLRRIFDEKIAMAFCLLWSLYPFSMSWAHEVRMYSWTEFFVFSATIFAYNAYARNHPSDWVFLSLSTLAAAYTQYFALVSAGGVYLLLIMATLRHRRDKSYIVPLVVAPVAMFICYLPWFGEFIAQMIVKVNNEYWIAPITPATVLIWFSMLFDNLNYMGNIIVMVIVVLMAVNLFRNGDRNVAILGASLLFIPFFTALVGLAASLLIRPVFLGRYLLPSTPGFVLFIVLSLFQVRRDYVRSFMFASILTIYLMSLYACFEKELAEKNAYNLDYEFAQKYSDADCFFTMPTESCEYSLHYFVGDRPVFSRQDDVPALAEYENVIFIADSDEMVPEYILNEYDAVYLEMTDDSITSPKAIYRLVWK